MIDKKLTDNEIIKDLEGAILNAKRCDSKVWSIEIYKLENALDLITRQQAKLENLTVENQSLRSAANSLKMHYEEALAEIERLKDEYEESKKRNQDLVYAFQSCKSEAYKEFAERLKAVYEGFDDKNEVILYSNLLTAIDCLLIGMVGDK